MRDRPHYLETIAACHVGAMALLATWALGGGVGWARDTLAVFGSLAPIITILAIRARLLSAHASLRVLWWLFPLAVFNIIVVTSLFHPGFRTAIIEGASILIPQPVPLFMPSSARPDLSLQELWLFNALYLPCFNLMLAVRHRRTLRNLLYFSVGNAVVLSIFGTLQKLTGADGLFFGRVHSPNATFFASFIYHNHWGAYAILGTAIGVGLIFNRDGRHHARDFFHSPAFAGAVAVFLLAATIPLCGSRSCTILVIAIIMAAIFHGFVRIQRTAQRSGRPSRVLLVAGAVAIAIAIASIYILARPIIHERASDTREQLREMRSMGGIGARAALYRNTWKMAADRLPFGWGLGSYGTVFQAYNTQESIDGLPQFYNDAHSDWLEITAETGLTGFACMAMLVALPILTLRRHRPLHSLSLHMLIGCVLVLMYAWIEFPFGSPAVTLTFWLCLFSCVRLSQLSASERSPSH